MTDPRIIPDEVLSSIEERAKTLSAAGWPGDANGILALLDHGKALAEQVTEWKSHTARQPSPGPRPTLPG